MLEDIKASYLSLTYKYFTLQTHSACRGGVHVCKNRLILVDIYLSGSYFWESCSKMAAFWEAGFCLAWLNHPRASYSTQSVPWLWPNRKWCTFSLFSNKAGPERWVEHLRLHKLCIHKRTEVMVCLCLGMWEVYCVLTFGLSIHKAVITEESFQQSFLRAPGLHSFFLHQPQQASRLICPGQCPYLNHMDTDEHARTLC